MQTVTEYFDPHNISHLKAWKELNKTGVWPRDFWELIKDKDFQGGHWAVLIANKIADAYIELMVKE